MDAAPTKPRKANWRWLLQFSLRSLLAVMLVAAVGFAWFGWRLRKSQRQARAADVLQEFGAMYAYDFQTFDYALGMNMAPNLRRPPVGTTGGSPYSRRLHELLGIDFLHNITRVHLETSYRLSEEDIDRLWTALSDLPDLVYLEASGPVTRPGAIQQLNRAYRLQRLALRWAHIADDDLAVLDRMPRLEELNLNETPVTDAAMVHVGRQPSIQAIELHHTKVGDAAMREIARLPRLKRLRLSGTGIGDEGIRHLRGLACLSDLDLEYTKITDAGMEHIAILSSLERLDISLTAVTEIGLTQLSRLPSLEHLRLDATEAMPAALETLPKLPALQELHVGGRVLSADLSPIADCRKLRSLDFASRSAWPMTHELKLPTTLEELSGIHLTDKLVAELKSLPNLKVIHTPYSSYNLEEAALVQRFRSIRPSVKVLNR